MSLENLPLDFTKPFTIQPQAETCGNVKDYFMTVINIGARKKGGEETLIECWSLGMKCKKM